MTKNMRELKNRINSNRKIVTEKSFIDIEIGNKLIKVDRNNINIDTKDIEEYIKDIVYTCNSIRKNQLIELSRVCDCSYNMIFCGCKGEEMYFKII